MGKSVRLKKGYNIKLEGEASKEVLDIPASDLFAVKPTDYLSITPKMLVKVGDKVLAGDALFTDKQRPEIKFPSPVSGEVVELVRGAKRKILEIRIAADKKSKYASQKIPKNLTAENCRSTILEGSLWSLFRQRPYSIIPDSQDVPKAIFVSTFDTSPLAPDLSFVIGESQAAFDMGLEVLDILSGSNLQIGVEAANPVSVSKGEVNTFQGPHPAGNVGIQIHHIDPIKSGETVWYIDAQDVIILGNFFISGNYQAERLIALTGSEVEAPKYLRTKIGQSLTGVFSQAVSATNARYIQGNVLFGQTSKAEDYLSFYTAQLTVIPEGNHSEFLGWLLPSVSKLSLSRTYFSWLTPNKKYKVDTNIHGEERAFVMSGEYERVLPMNIMPVQLLKAILVNDVERMEALGIYEIAEEDFALCEFICTSKIEVQNIVRQGLDLMRSEG